MENIILLKLFLILCFISKYKVLGHEHININPLPSITNGFQFNDMKEDNLADSTSTEEDEYIYAQSSEDGNRSDNNEVDFLETADNYGPVLHSNKLSDQGICLILKLIWHTLDI